MVSTANPSNVNAQDNSQPDGQKKTARPVNPWGILVQQLEQILETAQTESVSTEFKESLTTAYRLAAGLDPYFESCTTK